MLKENDVYRVLVVHKDGKPYVAFTFTVREQYAFTCKRDYYLSRDYTVEQYQYLNGALEPFEL